MRIYRLWKVARDNDCFGDIKKGEFHRAYCCIEAIPRKGEGRHRWCPRSVLLICQPTSATWVGDMIAEVGFRKAVLLERGVGRVVVYPVAPISERVEMK